MTAASCSILLVITILFQHSPCISASDNGTVNSAASKASPMAILPQPRPSAAGKVPIGATTPKPATTTTEDVLLIHLEGQSLDPSKVSVTGVGETFKQQVACMVNTPKTPLEDLTGLSLDRQQANGSAYQLLASVSSTYIGEKLGRAVTGEAAPQTATAEFSDNTLLFRDDQAACHSQGRYRCRANIRSAGLSGTKRQENITGTLLFSLVPDSINLTHNLTEAEGKPTMLLTCTCFYLDGGQVGSVSFSWHRQGKGKEEWENQTEGVEVQPLPSPKVCSDPQTSTLTKELTAQDENALYRCQVTLTPQWGEPKTLSAKFNVGELDYEDSSGGGSTQIVIGVCIGVVLFLVIGALVYYFVIRPRRARQETEQNE